MKVPSSLPNRSLQEKVPFSCYIIELKLLNQHSQQNLQSNVIKIKTDNKSFNDILSIMVYGHLQLITEKLEKLSNVQAKFFFASGRFK